MLLPFGSGDPSLVPPFLATPSSSRFSGGGLGYSAISGSCDPHQPIISHGHVFFLSLFFFSVLASEGRPSIFAACLTIARNTAPSHLLHVWSIPAPVTTAAVHWWSMVLRGRPFHCFSSATSILAASRLCRKCQHPGRHVARITERPPSAEARSASCGAIGWEKCWPEAER